MTELRRVRSGDRLRIPAPAWNAVLDAVDAVRATTPRASAVPGMANGRQGGVFPARNDGDEDIPRWGAIVLREPIVLPEDAAGVAGFEGRLAFAGGVATEDSEDETGTLAIAIAPIPIGDVGLAVVRDVVQAKVLVTTEEHAFASLDAGDTWLRSARSGDVRILWKESGSGLKRAIVDLGFRADGPRWLKVVGSAFLAENRWTYTLQDPEDSGFEVEATNAIEDDNTADWAGPGIDLSTLADGFALMPVGTDHSGNERECVVPAWRVGSDWRFCVANAIDGECSGSGSSGGSGGAPDLNGGTATSGGGGIDFDGGAAELAGAVAFVDGGIA